MAVAILREATREVQLERWRFNTEFGFELTPVDTFTWTNSDSSVLTLNIFQLPANVVSFDVTATPDQFQLDLVDRLSTRYQDNTPAYVHVLYDRGGNRDGLDSTKYSVVYINPVWMFEYEDCPDSFRAYVTALGSRRLARRVLGSTELGNFSKEDEAAALRRLRIDQAEDDLYNIFDNADVSGVMGQRPLFPTGVFDQRTNSR